jgi:pimeloyl-ACP methyl ester carboxylesterase
MLVAKLRAGDYQLEYVWSGPPPDEAMTLVFIHEGLGCVEMWGNFPEQVAAKTGCGALVYSCAGYGGSDPIELPRRVNFMHDEATLTLPQVLDETGVREAVLVGNSDGASIALVHAGSEEGCRVRGLVLEAPHVFVEQVTIDSITRAAEQYEGGGLKRSLERYHHSNVDCAFSGWNQVWLDPEFRSWNIEDYLPKIRVPILVIQGENDEYGTLRQVQSIERECSGSVQSLIVKDCGHNPHRDQPDRTVKVITSFIQEKILGINRAER